MLTVSTSADPYTGPPAETLRQRLGILVTGGITQVNIATNGGELLELEIVLSCLPPHNRDDEDEVEAAQVVAVTKVLRDAVDKRHIKHRPHRRILKFILPLKDKYLGTSVEERRAAAGEDITTGRKPIKPNSLRTYYNYEPQALDELARVLVEMEADHRKESRPAALADSH
jgi:hypothetical protein